MSPLSARAALMLPICVLACSTQTGPRDQRDSPVSSRCLIEGETPQTIADVVERINKLPHPASVACFVASLPRPLSVVATTSDFSVQAASGEANPRLFILTDGLVLSIIPAGESSHLLELGEWVSTTRTIKAEIPFPIEAPITHDTPYEVLNSPSITTCGLCHRNEVPTPERPGAFTSDAMRPLPQQHASLAALYAELEACDFVNDAERCEMLSALFDFGPVVEVSFSDELATFFVP
jgi:hypothetical protein